MQGNCEENIGVLKISEFGETALHIAVEAKHIDFVKELVKIMNENDLLKKNIYGDTVLHYAAASGKVELAQEVMKNNNSIAMIANNYGTLPIHLASWKEHREMVHYLYQKTRHFLQEDNRAELFVTCIDSGFYDIASQMLTDYPNLATARDTDNETALGVLARKNLKFSNLVNQNQQGIIKKCFNLGAKSDETEKMKAGQLVERIWKIAISSSTDEVSKLSIDLLFDAAGRGNDEFLSFLIYEYPDILWKSDGVKNYYTIFHIAVKNRLMNVFKLIREMGSIKDSIIFFQDEKCNNILHLAGMLAPEDRLNIVSGEALQFQRELMWFQVKCILHLSEVEKIVPKKFREVRNKEGFTPRALFLKEHQELRKNGEKWMKETANACIVVATLTATVAFAAALTVPGGNNQNTGFPIFIEKATFQVFAISDAVSLLFSLTSMTTFLNIFISKYAEEDMLWRLPRKFYIGMLTLLISLVALVAMFSTISFIFFKNKSLLAAILVAVVAPTPLYMLLLQNVGQTVYDVFLMTYNFYDVLRLTRDSDSLFKRGKSTFHKKEETSDQSQERKISSAQLKFSFPCSTNV
ncbi:Ankyrin repeat family protein [Melia azedarach]|uniref:Ankyrin repeat family protein n=1 Tax=Melia azedarach TaxID=155640 RepID=A0ACC1WVP6_MELAZ|nr:Ankyrin repeat family protein [Melia azedarach]